MENCENDNAPRLRTEVHAVWKPLRYDAPYASVNDGMELGLLRSERNAPINFRNERDAEVLALCLIPRCRLVELRASCTAERHLNVHRPMWASADALTSLQGTTSSGFAS